MGEINLSNHIGPYTGISYDQTVTITRPANGRKQKASERTFRIAIYGAYNAMGLIGSECNGIVILDNLWMIDGFGKFVWILAVVMPFGPFLLEMQGFYNYPLEKSAWKSLRQMTAVTAPVAGTVIEILAQEHQPVQFGDVLILLQPSEG